jgi:hypothetical protein
MHPKPNIHFASPDTHLTENSVGESTNLLKRHHVDVGDRDVVELKDSMYSKRDVFVVRCHKGDAADIYGDRLMYKSKGTLLTYTKILEHTVWSSCHPTRQ